MKQSIIGSSAIDPSSHIRFWVVAGLGLLADLWSKWYAWQSLQDVEGRSCELIKGFLSFKLVRNPGIAFGIELSRWMILSAVAVGIIVVLYLFLNSEKKARSFHIGLGLILAGAVGNLVDRLSWPYQVRDFIDFSFWPTFNLADAFLCVGVGLIALWILRGASSSS